MLTLLLSRDQSRGTDAILERLRADIANKQENRILLVPELISHDMERRLCQAAGDTASRYAQVLSFSQLASRVAEEVGSCAEEFLDNGGRLVVMAAAARQAQSRLKAYAAMATKPEFLTELVDAIDEFKRCCIGPADLKRASSEVEGSFAQKLEELSILMESYDALCAQGKRDPRDQMNWVLDQLPDTDFVAKNTFYIDGFPDFTRQHMEILKVLICNCPNVTLCLTCDHPGSDALSYEKAGQTAREIIQMAEKAGVKYDTVDVYGADTVLGRVCGSIFQGKLPDLTGAEAITLTRTNSVHQACMVAAQKVRDVVRADGRYRHVMVVCPDLAAFRAQLRLVFRRCGIPLYLAGTEDVLTFGAMQTVITALEAALEDLDQRSVLRYLRSSMGPLKLEEADQIENYAVIWGISGKKWLETWENHPDGLSGHWGSQAQNRLAELNTWRSKAVEPLNRLRQSLRAATRLSQQIEALYAFLLDIQFPQRLQALAQTQETEGDGRGAQICNQLWEILLKALEQMYDVLGNTAWKDEDFLRLLSLMLSQYDVGTIPPVLDAVTAGDVSAMRCHRAEHLIVLGANEGAFPGYTGGTGLLSDQERNALRQIGVPLTGGSLEGLQSEFAEIFGVFCGAKQTVHLICCDEPSFIYRRVQQAGAAEYVPDETVRYTAGNRFDAAAAVEDRASARNMGIEDAFDRVQQAVKYEFGTVASENVAALYGESLLLSASQVDRQAECRLSYFLQYGLRAKERKEATVDPAEFGTYVHYVLEQTARDVMQLGGFRQVDLEQTLEIADRHSKAYTAEHFSQLDSQRLEYLFRRNMQELELVVRELWAELHDAAFAPERFELSFAGDGEMPAIPISGAAIPGQLRGFVDRVDLWQQHGRNYVRVVDYKTGKKDFDYCDVFNGVGLQMLLYLFALEDGGDVITGQNAVPAGVQYFPARVPYISAQSAADETWEDQRKKQWVRKGLLLRDDDALKAMDPTEKMDRLNCKRNKDGELVGDVADRIQMKQLKQYVMALLRRMVNDIASGNVQPNPYTRGTTHDACTFCPYGSVCHKEYVTGRRNYKTMTQERFWEEIGKEVGKDG